MKRKISILSLILGIAPVAFIYKFSQQNATQSASVQIKDNNGIADISDLIIMGEVTSVVSMWDSAHTKIFTRITIKVVDILKGNFHPRWVYFDQIGGTVGETTMFVSHFPQPKFSVDDRAALFLEEKDGMLRMVGFVQGKKVVEAFGLVDGRFTMAPDQPEGRRVMEGQFPGVELLMDTNVPGVRSIFYMDAKGIYHFDEYIQQIKNLLKIRNGDGDQNI